MQLFTKRRYISKVIDAVALMGFAHEIKRKDKECIPQIFPSRQRRCKKI